MEPLLRGHPFCTKNDLSKGVRGGLSSGVEINIFVKNYS